MLYFSIFSHSCTAVQLYIIGPNGCCGTQLNALSWSIAMRGSHRCIPSMGLHKLWITACSEPPNPGIRISKLQKRGKKTTKFLLLLRQPHASDRRSGTVHDSCLHLWVYRQGWQNLFPQHRTWGVNGGCFALCPTQWHMQYLRRGRGILFCPFMTLVGCYRSGLRRRIRIFFGFNSTGS